MGRTFTPAVTANPVVVHPTESHDDMYPQYPCWSYENAWDPDSDAFFKDAVYEDFVSVLPLEPITPVDSSDGSTGSSGRDTPAELYPTYGQISPSAQDVSRWLQTTSSSSEATPFDGLIPIPTPRRHSTSERRRSFSQTPNTISTVFERLHTHHQVGRARVSQHLTAFVPDGGDSNTDVPVSLRPAVSVRTSEITPIQLPSSHPRSAVLQRQLMRTVTPPPAPMPSVPLPIMTPSGGSLQPSPPPSVSPRIYNWTMDRYSSPESPTAPVRIRVAPARWPVY
jgi:hypothetical protein